MSRTQALVVAIMAVFACVYLGVAIGYAESRVSDIESLKQEIQKVQAEFRQALEEKDRRIEALEKQLAELQGKVRENNAATSAASDLDKAVKEAQSAKIQASSSEAGDILSKQIGGATLRLMDLSAVVNVAGGTSTKRSEQIEILQGGAHDPKRRGFTFQQLELSMLGAVDPYFTAESHLVVTEEGLELEEAFATTTTLPWGLQAKAGYYLTEFGLINPTHPHSWAWIDQPVINTRLFGGDGMRNTGIRLGWLTPLPWSSEVRLGVQDPRGSTMPSFLGEGLGHHHHGGGEEHEEGIGGRPILDRDVRALKDLVYSGRWINAFDVSHTVSARLGLSGLYGPNNSGTDGRTWIYGADLTLKWRPRDAARGWPFLTWQSEVMYRAFHADGFAHDGERIPASTLRDWGFYTQLLWGIRRPWAAGLRYEFASGIGRSMEEEEFIARSQDPFRDDRHRLSPLLLWQPTEFSRLRFQYNYDRASHLKGREAHSVWFGFEFLLGAHPVHQY
ncbi:MAG: hypothetical protein WHX93_08785 [bacterium]